MIKLQSPPTSTSSFNENLPLTSASLLLQIRNPDDAGSWQRFQEVYVPIIQAFCRRRGFQAADIDDICQEVLAAVAQAIRRFDYRPDQGRFRSWLATITANKLRNHVRKTRRDEALSVDWIESLADRPADDSTWNSIFVSRIFTIACETVRHNFESNTWRCFELAWIERKPSSDVAKELNLPIHRVYVNKSRVLKQLEQEFCRLCDDHPRIG